MYGLPTRDVRRDVNPLHLECVFDRKFRHPRVDWGSLKIDHKIDLRSRILESGGTPTARALRVVPHMIDSSIHQRREGIGAS